MTCICEQAINILNGEKCTTDTAFYILSTIAQVLPTLYAATAAVVYFAQEALTAQLIAAKQREPAKDKRKRKHQR